MSAPSKKGSAPRTERHHDSDENSAQPEQVQGKRPSWRDFYQVHPACAEWPALSPYQWPTLKADLKANGLKVPIQTREVAGDPAKYVIDGYHRLDLMEELGWQIIDEHGNWMGAALGKVEHQKGRTHKQIGEEVNSYNGERRHMAKKELLECMARTRIKARQLPQGTTDVAKMDKSVKRDTGGRLAGSTKDPDKAAIEKAAEEMGASPRTARRAFDAAKRKLEPSAPPKRKPKPKPAKTKPKKEKSLDEAAHEAINKFIRKAKEDDYFSPEIKRSLAKCLIGVEDATDVRILPDSLNYGKQTLELGAVLDGFASLTKKGGQPE